RRHRIRHTGRVRRHDRGGLSHGRSGDHHDGAVPARDLGRTRPEHPALPDPPRRPDRGGDPACSGRLTRLPPPTSRLPHRQRGPGPSSRGPGPLSSMRGAAVWPDPPSNYDSDHTMNCRGMTVQAGVLAALDPVAPPPGANDWDCVPTPERPHPVVLVNPTFTTQALA